MSELDNTDDFDVEIQDEELETEEIAEESAQEDIPEDETDWKAEALKYKAIAERKSKQADKAKELPKQEAPAPAENKQEADLTAKDAIVLMKSGVDNDEDIDEVVQFAKFRNIPISEALKSPVVKTLLAQKAEERKTAEAASTAGSRRGTSKPSTATILDNALNGKLPDDPVELARAQMEQRKNQAK